MLRRAEERYVNAELLCFVHGRHSALPALAGYAHPRNRHGENTLVSHSKSVLSASGI
jgi:hypothetical protein